MGLQVVDLFCGVGGLTHGLINKGFNVKAGFDFDNTCRFAYENNNKSTFINKDIRKTTAEDIIQFYNKDDIKILVGCAPCQPFSMMRKKLGTNHNESDEKYDLLLEFGRLIDVIQPEIVSMENVPSIRSTGVFQKFLDVLDKHNYYYDYKVIHTSDYGVPQNRRRFVLLASRIGEISLIKPTHNKEDVKVRDFIGNLPKVKAGEQCETDPLHKSANLSELNLKRIKHSKPGGTWKDWPSELVAACHKKESGKTFTSVYSRMEWDKIGPTITTQFLLYGTGRFGHPEQDRALTLREGALLQTFPLDYKFIDPNKNFVMRDIARHIGNAVPVRLGEVIGESIKKHIEDYKL